MKQAKKKEYEVWKHVLDTFDVGDRVETPYGQGTIYMDFGEFLQVAVTLTNDQDHEPFSYFPVIMTVPRSKIRRLEQ